MSYHEIHNKKTELSQGDLDDVINYLQGTCNTLEDAIVELFGVDYYEVIIDHDYIDSFVFLCDECGWWYESCQRSEEDCGCCEDCRPEKD